MRFFRHLAKRLQCHVFSQKSFRYQSHHLLTNLILKDRWFSNSLAISLWVEFRTLLVWVVKKRLLVEFSRNSSTITIRKFLKSVLGMAKSSSIITTFQLTIKTKNKISEWGFIILSSYPSIKILSKKCILSFRLISIQNLWNNSYKKLEASKSVQKVNSKSLKNLK